MNQLTREWLQNRISEMETTRDDIPFGFDEDGNNELAAYKLALAAMLQAGNADSTSPCGRVISIRHKDYSRIDALETSAHAWPGATPQPADRQTSSLVMWVKRPSLSLRSVSPDNKLPKAAMGYLQNNGLISIADCLRGNNEEPPA